MLSCDQGKTDLNIAAVNDDFCDCLDGSDEPGTSACAGVGSSQFYCENKNYGGPGKFIPSSRVFDGICDCCDGSDENSFDPSQPCKDTCLEDGREFRIEQAKRAKAISAGLEKKQQYILQGKQAAGGTETDTKIKALNVEYDELKAKRETVQAKVAELESIRDAKRKEFLHQLNKKRVQSLMLGELNRSQLELLVVKVAAEQLDSTSLTDEVNQLLRENRAAAKPVAMQVGVDGSVEQVESEEEEDTNDVAIWLPEDDLDLDKDSYGEEEKGEEEDDDEGGVSANNNEEQGDELAIESDKLQELDTRTQEIEKELDKLEEERKNDYGPENEWYPLRDKCFEVKADGYTYKMCPYQEAKQDHVLLGKWKGFKEDSNYKVLMFEGGQKCWNGPLRSLTVTVSCGEEEVLEDVSEPSMCEYTAKFQTPAAC